MSRLKGQFQYYLKLKKRTILLIRNFLVFVSYPKCSKPLISLFPGWSAYYCNTEFVILVIDSTDRERLHLSKEELWKLLNNDELAKASILIYANKQDISGCMTAAEISSELNLTSIKKHKWQIQACSALTGQG